MNSRALNQTQLVAIIGLSAVIALGLTGPAAAEASRTCGDDLLNGRYVFTAIGFTRAPNSGPGTPWVPKAILEVLEFNGDGTLSTPGLAVANPFGDNGAVLQPPSGAPGEYSIDESCTGSVHFFDAGNVTFYIYVEPPRGESIWMIQTNPTNNVFQGTARRVW